MRNYKLLIGMVLLYVLGAVVQSCKDDLDNGTYYTTDALTLTETLELDLESYSEYLNILNKTGYYSSLQSYGSYTCFVPVNSAIKSYIQGKFGVNTVSELTTEEQIADLKLLIQFHTLPSKKWSTAFVEGRMTDTTFTGDYLTTSYLDGGGVSNITINQNSKLVEYDISADNGLIHAIDKVIEPYVYGIPRVMEEKGEHTIFVEAMKQTNLFDTYCEIYNESGGRYLYTILAETDSVYNLSGIKSFDDLALEISPEDADYTNPQNEMYRFVAYHITAASYYSPDFASGFVSTEAEGEALEVEKTEDIFKINEEVTEETSSWVSLVMGESNIPAKNGVYHTVDTLMTVYTPSASYIIFDVARDQPEVLSGAIGRLKSKTTDAWSGIDWYPTDLTTRWNSKSSNVNYNYSILDCSGSAAYYEFLTPIIPKGQYDMLILANGGNSARGVFQFYWDDEPIGKVWDVRTKGANVGWPDSTLLEANGFRKGLSWITNKAGTKQSEVANKIRFHITDELLCPEQKRHVLKMVSVKSGGCPIDYIEWIPVEK